MAVPSWSIGRTVPFDLVRILASDAAAAVGGRLIGPDVEFDGASFDSRSTQPGELFVPIVAERDGHDFIDQARAAGAVAHLTSRPFDSGDGGTAIEVADTSDALMTLAQWARRRSTARVVGVTGSVGKTSTKDFIAAACDATRQTTANVRSYNNEQGLPVTILNAPDDTEVLVLEMGMRGFGEITRLCDVARPDIGVVTAVGHSHTERVGGIDGVAVANRELVQALPTSGTAVLNADDERVMAMAAHTGASVITYGRAGDVRVTDLVLDELARPRFTIDTPWGQPVGDEHPRVEHPCGEQFGGPLVAVQHRHRAGDGDLLVVDLVRARWWPAPRRRRPRTAGTCRPGDPAQAVLDGRLVAGRVDDELPPRGGPARRRR